MYGIDVGDLVQDKGTLVSRRLFSDPEIYRLELDRIFSRTWQFLAHDTQIPRPGDFLTTFMGETPVLVVRQTDGSVKALLNACTHRGTMLCIAEEGNAKAFTCPYHGWSFGFDGELIAVPRESDYHGALNRKQMALPSVQVDSYKGLYFGNLDSKAPRLAEYLADFVWYLDVIFDPLPTGVEFVGGTMRQRLKCNWKVAAENIFADTYHVLSAHAVAASVCMQGRKISIGIEEGQNDSGKADISATLNGHGWNANFDGHGVFALFQNPAPWIAYVDRQRPRYIDHLSEDRAWFIGSSIDGGIFPNFMFVPGFTFRQVHPKGPNDCEVAMWTVVERELPDELKEEMVRFNARMLGTSGMFETDDCANMERLQMTARDPQSAKHFSNYAMGKGREKAHPVYPGLVDQRISDNCFRGYYRRWAQLMGSKD
jgi:phenylpropionate dioxygenase-like ring-hydroxylating dioxygenase large terminal subunit